MNALDLSRRQFLQRTGMVAGLAGASLLSQASASADSDSSQTVRAKKAIALLRDPEDKLATAPAVRWAVSQLSDALATHGFSVSLRQQMSEVTAEELCVVIGSTAAALPREILGKANSKVPSASDALVLLAGLANQRPDVL